MVTFKSVTVVFTLQYCRYVFHLKLWDSVSNHKVDWFSEMDGI